MISVKIKVNVEIKCHKGADIVPLSFPFVGMIKREISGVGMMNDLQYSGHTYTKNVYDAYLNFKYHLFYIFYFNKPIWGHDTQKLC